jgi:hypothetical protein
MQLCMVTPERKLCEQIDTVWKVREAPARMARRRMSHRDVLVAALQKSCICEGNAVAGWEKILTMNEIPVEEYKKSVLHMLEQGGGKGANHYYYGVASSGKTALTRPLQETWATVSQCVSA